MDYKKRFFYFFKKNTVSLIICLEFDPFYDLILKKKNKIKCPGGGIGRHKGLKIPR